MEFENLKRKKRKRCKKQTKTIPGWLYLGLMLVYHEVLLHLWTTPDGNLHQLAAVFLFALTTGAVLALAVSFLPAKAGKWVSFGGGIVLTVLYMTEYFLENAFQLFMSLSVVAAGAGGVATDFADTVKTLIAIHFWRIVLLLLPTILFALFCRPRRVRRTTAPRLAGFAAVCCALTVLVVRLVPGYGDGFNAFAFDNAVRDYGLHVALVLDAAKGQEGASFTDVPGATDPSESETEEFTEEATEAETVPVVREPQVLGLDFAALAAAESHKEVASLHSYVASLTPSMTNEYTGLLEGKNLILITAEAFTGAWLDPELTPTLWRLVHEGIYFSDYYQPLWGASTTGGEYSNVVGLVPNSGKCMKETTQQDFFLTMGNQLQALGYSSAAYHNNSYTYYSRNETHTLLGYDKFIGMGNGMEAGVTNCWPQSDVEMIDFTIPQHLDAQPFSLYYMSVSGHSEYSQGGNDMSRKNYSIVADMDASEAIKCYIAANLEFEYAMASLVAQLEEAGIADDTVIAISSDHYPYGLDQSDAWGTSESYLSELFGQPCDSRFVRDQNALIIWSGCLEDMDIVVGDPVSSLDLLPTLSNLFGVEYDSRLLPGRDVFSDTAPLVFWPDYSWKTDKGTYNSSNRTFTPNEGVTVDDGYVDRISSQVKNKLTYSKSVQKEDYFNYVVKALGN